MTKSVRINKHLYVDQSMFNFLSNSNNIITSIILNIDCNEDFNFLMPSDKSDFITYLGSDKLKKFDGSDPFVRGIGRTSMKIGRFIKKFIPEEYLTRYDISNSTIEQFVNLYKSWFDSSNYRFEIVSGEEIIKWYNELNYFTPNGSTFGTLWNSCMRYQKRLKFLSLYTKNKNVKMLVMITNVNGRDEVRARALLWENVEVINSHIELPSMINVMDRIYTIYDSDVFIFKKWADENGYISKWEQNAKSHQFFDIKNEPVKIKCTFKLENSNLLYYPYLDTFPYFNFNNGTISNDEYGFSWDYKLVQATGGLEPERNEQDEEYEQEDW
jgi:hypothetical protein